MSNNNNTLMSNVNAKNGNKKRQNTNNNNRANKSNNPWTGNQPDQSKNKPSTTKFMGECDDLKGNIFDCYNAKQSDMYISTKHEIKEYVGRTYTYDVNIMWSLEKLKGHNISKTRSTHLSKGQH